MFEFDGFRLGFFCSTADGKITTNRKFRLSNLTESKLIQTVEQNLEDFKKLLEISSRMGLGIFRLGSEVVPFASYPEFKKDWFKRIEKMLVDFAPEVKRFGIRITMHPGQFVVLSSKNPAVVESSLRELEYHFWVLDCLGVGDDGVVVVHGGGVYDSKQKSLERFKDTLDKNPWLKKRLVVENDEKSYTVADLLPLGLPVVYDHYHNSLNPSDFKPEDIIRTWNGKVPEFHLSSKPDRPHRFGEHGDYVDVEDFLDMHRMFKGSRVDVVVEAKKKEIAIQRLVNDLKG